MILKTFWGQILRKKGVVACLLTGPLVGSQNSSQTCNIKIYNKL